MLMYAACLDFVEVQLNYTSMAEYGAIDSEGRVFINMLV
jgi:hypothetical protein